MSPAASPDIPFENIQYLSRNHIHHPGPPDTEWARDLPEVAIKKAAARQWDRYIHKQPLDVNPSFMASPQTLYLGSTTCESGQIVHDLVNLNSVQALYNKEDGRPCVLTGHLYSRLVQTPSSTSVIWPLEVQYPSDERIQAAITSSYSSLDQSNLHDRFSSIMPSSTQGAQKAHLDSTTMPTRPVSHILRDDFETHQKFQLSTPPITVWPQDTVLDKEHSTVIDPGHTGPDADEGNGRPAVPDRRATPSLGYTVIYGHVVLDSPPSDSESMSPLEPIPPSSDEDDPSHHLFPPKPGRVSQDLCDYCNGQRHEFYECLKWHLPPLVLDSGWDDSMDAIGEEEVTPEDVPMPRDSDSTPTNPLLPLQSKPSMTEVAVPEGENVALRSLHQILGLEPTALQDVAHMRELAHMAAAQSQAALKIYDARLAELPARESESAADECAAPSSLVQVLTETLLMRRNSFGLTLGTKASTEGRTGIIPPFEARSVITEALHFGPPGPALDPNHMSSEQLPEHTSGTSDNSPSESFNDAMAGLSFSTPSYSPIHSSSLSPISDRSVYYECEEIEPQEVIDKAIRSITAGSLTKHFLTPNSPISPPGDYPSPTLSDPLAAVLPVDSSAVLPDEDEDSLSIASLDSDEFLTEINALMGFPPIFQYQDGTDTAVSGEIIQWTEHAMERESFSRKWDADFAGGALKAARTRVYDSLHSFLDTDTMVANNLRDYNRSIAQYRAMFRGDPPERSGAEPVIIGGPHHAHPTPSAEVFIPQVPSPPVSVHDSVDRDSGADDTRTRSQSRHTLDGFQFHTDSGGKRKAVDSGPSSPTRPWKRLRKFRGDNLWRKIIHQEGFKATRYLNGDISYVWRQILEGTQHLEDVLVRKKSDFRAARQQYFAEYGWVVGDESVGSNFACSQQSQHPLLFDTELAKLQILYILLHHRGYFDIAWVVNDLIRLRFKDSYALSLLLNAGYLDFLTPIETNDFWDSADSSSELSDSDEPQLGYPSPSLANATLGHCPQPRSYVPVTHPTLQKRPKQRARSPVNASNDMDVEDEHRDKRVALSINVRIVDASSSALGYQLAEALDPAPPYTTTTSEATRAEPANDPGVAPDFADSLLLRSVSREAMVAAN
ncbi:hypothetical protein DFH07DRAFT_953656 [Mycena maculata]|uniref:Uncharacterized protein n=1 Tax=Mycena maculata TaxID=230809 RepID=A0AAD7NQQ9_9AGAR|nr:hypothetical protein DFH07DRAFT_953656 [Mycena maculata]